jgi:ketosteroid isomerase-like protein
LAGIDPKNVAAQFFAHFITGNVEGAMDLMAADAILTEPSDLPFSGSYTGPEGLADFAKSLPRSVRISTAEPRIDAAGELAIVRMRLTFQCRRSERKATTEAIEVYRIIDGKITKIDVYYASILAIRELYAASTV